MDGTATKPHVRWMIRRDVPEVLEIERTSYDNYWLEEDFLRCLRQRNTIGMVAEFGDYVFGFMIYELHKSRLQVLNMAVDPKRRREGIGRALVDKLKSKLASHRRVRIRMEIRESNLPGQLFLRSQGFKADRVLRDHYEDTGEAAYRMVHALEDAGPEPEPEPPKWQDEQV